MLTQLLNQIRQALSEGELAAAGQLLREAGRLAPEDPALLHQLGLWLAIQQRYPQALAVLAPLETQVQQVDLLPELLNDLGIVLTELGRLPEAGQRFERALALNPAHPLYRLNLADTHTALAGRLQLQGRYAEALSHWQPVLQLQPVRSEAWIQTAEAHDKLGDSAQAESALLNAIRLMPDSPIARYNLGNLYFRRQDYTLALEQLERAIRLGNSAEAWINLGLCRYELGDYPGSLQATREAVRLAPDNPRFHIHLADSLLMNGHFTEGFSEIQWRFQDRLYQGFRYLAPVWQGEPLAGRHLLIQAEQGLGDILMFSRLIPWLHQRWPEARLSFRCPQSLHGLFRHWDWLECVPADSTTEPLTADSAVAILSLAQLLKLNPLALPDAPPYLQVTGELPAALAEVFAHPRRQPRIGIVWSSGPGKTRGKRSLKLSMLAALFSRFPEAEFYSLQKGEPGAELEPYRTQISDLGPYLENFSDTAHALQALDLLISVDTSVSHLAGALNLPVWILLPFAPEWRWGPKGDTSPWYPSARLLRQRSPGDWSGLIAEQLIPALDNWLKES